LTKNVKSTVAAIIVAAGSGQRMGGAIPKQFLEINGKAILRYTLEKFQSCPEIEQIYVILPANFIATYEEVFRVEWKIDNLVKVVAGGAERHLSVWAGLEALEKDVEIVMIHDGVRPFVSSRILRESIFAAEQFGAAVVGLTPKDTVKQIAGEYVEKTMNREQLLLAQTPQTFRKDVIVNANKNAFRTGSFSTDDAALVEQMGMRVAIVPGEWTNIKITSPEDLVVARAIIERGLCE
jgi:2-C-methyl-D-erythritol 4-phosphate cytidylyltransferase